MVTSSSTNFYIFFYYKDHLQKEMGLTQVFIQLRLTIEQKRVILSLDINQ